MTTPARPGAGIYETQKLLSQYLLFHYGSAGDIIPAEFGSILESVPLEFPVRCVECFSLERIPSNARALDLGCAVGRATFELARQSESVIGIDYSQVFIEAANSLKEKGLLDYERMNEGRNATVCTARVPDGIDRSRVRFERGDAGELPESLGSFDLVLAANLFCRLPEPRRLLERLPRLVRAGGQLVITTPCTWLEEFTPEENWIARRDLPTLEGFKGALDSAFELERVCDLPFLIREHRRKYEIGLAQGSVWRRRGTD